MGNSIDDLKASIGNHGGLALSNRFRVIFTPPKMSLLNLNPTNLIGNLASGSLSLKNLINDPRDISLLCKSTSMPSRQIGTTDYQGHRQSMKVPNMISDEEINMVFMITNDMYIKVMFDNWSDEIFNARDYRLGWKKDYQTDVTIQQLNKENKPVYGVRLINAFPTSIGGLSLDNASENNPHEFSVQWTYDYWVAEDALSSTLGAGLRAIGNLIS